MGGDGGLGTEGRDVELDGGCDIGERLFVRVALANYDTLQTEGVGDITIGMLLNDYLDVPVHSSPAV